MTLSLHSVTMGEAHDQAVPLVLLHDWPQSWFAWRYVCQRLQAAQAHARAGAGW